MNIGLLDSLLSGRPVNLGYLIVRHMLTTPAVTHRLLPYGSLITHILRHFHVPLREAVYKEPRRIGRDAMSSIGFTRRDGRWHKIANAKNQDTLIAPEDDQMLNDIYTPDQLPDFRLGARPPPPRRQDAPPSSVPSSSAAPELDSDFPSISEPPPAPQQPYVPPQPPAPDHHTSAILAQLVEDVRLISENQRKILDHMDAITRDHHVLQSQIQTLQDVSLDHQYELIAGQRQLLGYFGYDPGSTSAAASPPRPTSSCPAQPSPARSSSRRSSSARPPTSRRAS